MTFDGDDANYEIVGVAGDAKYYEIREAVPRTVYFNMFQQPGVFSQFAIRTAVNPESITPKVRRAVRDLLKTVPIARVTTLDDQVDASIVPERVIAMLSGIFGSLGDATRMVLRDALIMVCIGLILGAPLAYWTKAFAATLIEDLPVENILPIALAALAMIAIGLFATYIPARRAAPVDPMEALRYE